MKRVPEKELMDVPLHALAYANANFSEPNSTFVALFAEKFPAFNGQRILDLGCGPADITIRLAARYPQSQIIGVDGAESMIDIAKNAIRRHDSLDNRVQIRNWHIGREDNPFGPNIFQAVVSNSLLHHMDDPLDLWKAVLACAAPGAAVLVMDLMRPLSCSDAEKIVETYAGEEPEVLRSDFLNSLLAAYRPAEVIAQLASAGVDSLRVEAVSDRHFIVFGSIGCSAASS